MPNKNTAKSETIKEPFTTTEKFFFFLMIGFAAGTW